MKLAHATRQRPLLRRFLAEAVEFGYLSYADAVLLAARLSLDPFGRARSGWRSRRVALGLCCAAAGTVLLVVALVRP